MSATTSSVPGAQAKAQQTQPARQGPRVSNGNSGAPKKAQNGSPKPDAGRKSPQPGTNGQSAKAKPQSKPKASAPVSEYLRQRGATVEVANAVTQIRSDLGGYYSEELVYNTFVANGNNAEATRTALTQSKATSWASKVSPAAAVAAPSGAVAAPVHIAAQQQGPRPRKVNKAPAQTAPKTETVEVVAEPAPVAEPIVDPEQMQKSLESALQATQTQAQELLHLQAEVTQVRTAQNELTAEKDTLLKRIAEHEAEIAKDRTRIQTIDATLGQHKGTLAELQKTIAQKTSKQ